MNDLAAILDRELRAAGVPILGVRIGNADDRSTWGIAYMPEATDRERETGDALLRTFDPSSVAVTDREVVAATTRLIAGNKPVVAVALALYTTILQREPTVQEQQALLELTKTIYLGLP